MRDDSPASRTALMVAGYRARATARDNPVCTDPWASDLAGELGLQLAENFDKSFAHMELWIALRVRYLDDQVAAFCDSGVRQIVMLGAGLDTRAARLARDGVRFFEVDHPSTQQHKRAEIAKLAGYPVDAATFVSCDFENQDFLDQLTGAGFDPSAPAVIVWEGVVPYLTEPAIRATATRIADGCHDRTMLFFDFVGKRLLQGSARNKDKETLDYVDDLGEPLHFGTNDILPLLYECGFGYVRSLSFDEIGLAYTGTYAREREFRFQSMAVASKTVPADLWP